MSRMTQMRIHTMVALMLQVTSQRIDKAIAGRKAHLVVIVGQGRAQLQRTPSFLSLKGLAGAVMTGEEA